MKTGGKRKGGGMSDKAYHQLELQEAKWDIQTLIKQMRYIKRTKWLTVSEKVALIDKVKDECDKLLEKLGV